MPFHTGLIETQSGRGPALPGNLRSIFPPGWRPAMHLPFGKFNRVGFPDQTRPAFTEFFKGQPQTPASPKMSASFCRFMLKYHMKTGSDPPVALFLLLNYPDQRNAAQTDLHVLFWQAAPVSPGLLYTIKVVLHLSVLLKQLND